MLVFLAVALGLFYLRLSAAPVSFGRLPERVAEAMAARIGPGWNVTLRNTAIELHDGSPALRANGLDIRAPGGDLVLRAPYAILSVDLMSLLTANLQPKAIEVRDLQLRVLVNRDGSLTFSPVQAETETGNAAPPPVAPAPSKEAAASLARDANGPSPVSGAIGSLLELIVGPSSVLNTLGQAQLTNARLVFIDADGRERARLPARGCRLRLGGKRRSPVCRDGGGRPGPLAAERRRHRAGQRLLPRERHGRGRADQGHSAADRVVRPAGNDGCGILRTLRHRPLPTGASPS